MIRLIRVLMTSGRLSLDLNAIQSPTVGERLGRTLTKTGMKAEIAFGGAVGQRCRDRAVVPTAAGTAQQPSIRTDFYGPTRAPLRTAGKTEVVRCGIMHCIVAAGTARKTMCLATQNPGAI